ncbi:hypothetical protein JNL27_10825 [bacterium]|nr:hypothetical protein [bacterium]
MSTQKPKASDYFNLYCVFYTLSGIDQTYGTPWSWNKIFIIVEENARLYFYGYTTVP